MCLTRPFFNFPCCRLLSYISKPFINSKKLSRIFYASITIPSLKFLGTTNNTEEEAEERKLTISSYSWFLKFFHENCSRNPCITLSHNNSERTRARSPAGIVIPAPYFPGGRWWSTAAGEFIDSAVVQHLWRPLSDRLNATKDCFRSSKHLFNNLSNYKLSRGMIRLEAKNSLIRKHSVKCHLKFLIVKIITQRCYVNNLKQSFESRKV